MNSQFAKMKPAVFLDRDGVLIEEKNYLHRVEDVTFLPGVAAALKRLSDAGFKLFIVSNQSGVGRGYFHTCGRGARQRAFAPRNWPGPACASKKIYIAPEAPDQPSRGRKPSPQFLFDARDEFGVDLAQSFMIGVQADRSENAAGTPGVKTSILVRYRLRRQT